RAADQEVVLDGEILRPGRDVERHLAAFVVSDDIVSGRAAAADETKPDARAAKHIPKTRRDARLAAAQRQYSERRIAAAVARNDGARRRRARGVAGQRHPGRAVVGRSARRQMRAEGERVEVA